MPPKKFEIIVSVGKYILVHNSMHTYDIQFRLLLEAKYIFRSSHCLIILESGIVSQQDIASMNYTVMKIYLSDLCQRL